MTRPIQVRIQVRTWGFMSGTQASTDTKKARFYVYLRMDRFNRRLASIGDRCDVP